MLPALLHVLKLYHKSEYLKGRSFSKNTHKLPKNPERKRSLVLHAPYRTVHSWKHAKAEMPVLKMLLRCKTGKQPNYQTDSAY